jgi:plasmid stabilization system protein ParE
MLGLRSTKVKKHIIFYRFVEGETEIDRVLQKKMDHLNHLMKL